MMGWGIGDGWRNAFRDSWDWVSGRGGWGWGLVIRTGNGLWVIRVAAGNLCQIGTEVFFGILLIGIGIWVWAGWEASIRWCGGWAGFFSLLYSNCSGTNFTIIKKFTGLIPDKRCQSIFLTLPPVIQKSEHFWLVNLRRISPCKTFGIAFLQDPVRRRVANLRPGDYSALLAESVPWVSYVSMHVCNVPRDVRIWMVQ